MVNTKGTRTVVKYIDRRLANMLTNSETGYMELYHAIIFILRILESYHIRFFLFCFFKFLKKVLIPTTRKQKRGLPQISLQLNFPLFQPHFLFLEQKGQ